MVGKIAIFIVSTVFFLVFGIFTYTYFGNVSIQSRAENLVYNAADSASTTGQLSSNLYTYLSDNLNNLSRGSEDNRYFIQLKLEKYIRPGVYDIFYESSEDIARLNCTTSSNPNSYCRKGSIIDRPLDVGDRLSIFVQDRTPTAWGQLASMPLINRGDGRIRTISTSTSTIIVKRIGNASRGYDVIADINSQQYNTINRIQVITKLNKTGKNYTTPANPPYTLPYNISNVTDVNFINPLGEFLMDEDIVNGVKIRRYTQRY
ncbi:hypothetical protein ABGV42_00185 [Paenibacillus pabuli]|uniref:hypothetical protein n=1 Tax=Paenibacillus pabuli TaxID=1472 RepID=UPI003242547A